MASIEIPAWANKASRRTATPYVLTHLAGSRKVLEPTHNVLHRIVADAYDRLPDDVRDSFDAYNAAADHTASTVRTWGNEFVRAYTQGALVPDLRGGLHGLADRKYDWDDRMITLAAVIDAGEAGVTVAEIKALTGRVSNSVSGHLTTLHEAGVIARLAQRRVAFA